MNRKIFIIISFALAIGFTQIKASETEEINTLFGNGKINHSFYAGPVIKFTQFNDELSIFAGGRGGWTINKTFTVGIAGYGNLTWPNIAYQRSIINSSDSGSGTGNLMFGYGGMYFEYIYKPTNLVHFSSNVLMGFGGSTLMTDSLRSEDFNDYEMGNMGMNNNPWALYMVVEPSIAVELNVTTFFRVTLEAGYRWVNNINKSKNYEKINAIEDNKMSGFSGGLTLEFGIF